MSFVEIYKEEIFDLLSPTLTKIEIKNDKGTLNVEIWEQIFVNKNIWEKNE